MNSNKLDLRQVGMVTGLPIYVDLAKVKDFVEKGSLLSERNK